MLPRFSVLPVITPSTLSSAATLRMWASLTLVAFRSSAVASHFASGTSECFFFRSFSRSSWKSSALGPVNSRTTMRLRACAAVGHAHSASTSAHAAQAIALLAEAIDREVVMGSSRLDGIAASRAA